MVEIVAYVIQPYSIEHRREVLDACDKSTALGFRDYTMIALMADTGIRLGELIRLAFDGFHQSTARARATSRSSARASVSVGSA